MFISSQYQLADKFEDKEEFRMKLRFHVVLGKKEEEVWSLFKIVKVLNISKDTMFEGLLHNFRYHVVKENNVACDFSVVDFPYMNLNDLLNVEKILSYVDVLKLQANKKEDFVIGFAHIKLFINDYYDCLGMTDVELALAMNRTVTVPQSMLKGQGSLKNFEDGEICLKPLGVVFVGKNKNKKVTKFLFQVCDVERYMNSQYMNLLVCLNNCMRNTTGDKDEVQKMIIW